MSEQKRENKMGTMSEGKLLITMAAPMIVSMLVQAFYNVVDSIYVSRISESAVTALSLAFPVQMLLIGFAVGIGVGVNSLLSKSLGQRRQEQANFTAGNGILLTLLAAGLFLLFGIFGARPYFEMQSDVTETVEGGAAYTQICSIFALGILAEILGERLLQATGRTMLTMVSQGIGSIVNIVLDPVFIFGWFGLPEMGLAGAAVATVLGQWCGALLALFFNWKHNPDVQFGLRYLAPKKHILGPILSVGIPATIVNGIGSVMNFGMNQILQGFHETATGVFGIYYKLQSLIFMPVFGANNATISIVAFNYGAQKPRRITKTLKHACVFAFSVMTAGFLMFQFIPDVLLGFFNPTPEFLSIGRKALRIISWHFPMAAFGIALSASFQALGNGVYSTIVSLCRQLVVLLPAAYLLSLSGNIDAVWWSFPIAEFVSMALTFALFARIYRKKIHPMFALQK